MIYFFSKPSLPALRSRNFLFNGSGGYMTGRKGVGAQVGDTYHWYCAEAKMNAAKLRFAFAIMKCKLKLCFLLRI
jgi:hypothetical protein